MIDLDELKSITQLANTQHEKWPTTLEVANFKFFYPECELISFCSPAVILELIEELEDLRNYRECF